MTAHSYYMTFEQLELIEPIRKALKKEKYTTPTPIQAEAIPVVLDGSDLLGCAQTGTGKTAAFSIPIIQKIEERISRGRKPGIKALILTPTRELAIQIGESFTAYGRYTHVKHTVIFGGVGQKPQTDALERGVDVLDRNSRASAGFDQPRFYPPGHIGIFCFGRSRPDAGYGIYP